MDQLIAKKHLEKIIPVRVSVEHWEQIRKEANRKGIGVSTLTRIWIMEYLRKQADGTLPTEK